MFSSTRFITKTKPIQKIFRSISKTTKLQVFKDVITPEEETIMLNALETVLRRRRYEGNHWDDVIQQYKEIDFNYYPFEDRVKEITKKVQNFIRQQINEAELEFQSCHVIDISAAGFIGPHIDSIKFSGDMICGLSLISERIMVLSKDIQYNDQMDLKYLEDEKVFPQHVTLDLPPRSIYIMRGDWRYHYSHAVIGAKNGETLPKSLSQFHYTYPINRRISIIFRNNLDPITAASLYSMKDKPSY